MFKKKFRFPFRARFGNFRQRAFPQFNLKTRENNLLVSRVAIIVSKKVDGRAVIRNRVRRTMSACLEDLWGGVKLGFDALLIAKRGSQDQSKQRMFKFLKEAFEKEGLLK